jgi:hypothetical protein
MTWRSRRWALPAEIARCSWPSAPMPARPGPRPAWWGLSSAGLPACHRSWHARPPPGLAAPDLRLWPGFAVGLAEWWHGVLVRPRASWCGRSPEAEKTKGPPWRTLEADRCGPCVHSPRVVRRPQGLPARLPLGATGSASSFYLPSLALAPGLPGARGALADPADPGAPAEHAHPPVQGWTRLLVRGGHPSGSA